VVVHESFQGGGDRFEFGKNWRQFLRLLDSTRIRQAEESLAQMSAAFRIERSTRLVATGLRATKSRCAMTTQQ